jgi:hypothetical protein
VIHGNQTEHVPDAYRRYLENYFRKRFRLEGTPMRIEFRTDENPYAGRRNELTPRQRRNSIRYDRLACHRRLAQLTEDRPQPLEETSGCPRIRRCFGEDLRTRKPWFDVR